jgi:hypothetical protein
MFAADLEHNVADGDKHWAAMMTTLSSASQSQWRFNSQCCATSAYKQMATCGASPVAAKHAGQGTKHVVQGVKVADE